MCGSWSGWRRCSSPGLPWPLARPGRRPGWPTTRTRWRGSTCRGSGSPRAVRVRTASGAEVPVRVRNGRLWPLDAPGRRAADCRARRAPAVVCRLARRSHRDAPLHGRDADRPPARPLASGRARRASHGRLRPAGAASSSARAGPADTTASPIRAPPSDRPDRDRQRGGRCRRRRRSRAVVGAPLVAGACDVVPGDAVPAGARVAERRAPSCRRPEAAEAQLFSSPVNDVLGTKLPAVDTPGRWRTLDDHTIAFRPSGPGFPLDSAVTVRLPRAVHTIGSAGASLATRCDGTSRRGSTTRLEQLLAEQGYLPLDWQPDADPVLRRSLRSSAPPSTRPPGRSPGVSANTPPELSRSGRKETGTRSSAAP